MGRRLLATLLCLVAGCGGAGSAPARDGPPRRAPPRLPRGPGLDLESLAALVPGGVELEAGPEPLPSPSTVVEVDAFLRSLGASEGCPEEGSWSEVAPGVAERVCAVDEVSVGRTRATLRLRLLRVDLPGADATPRLFRIEIAPRGGPEPVGPRPDWSSAMLVEATLAHGGPAQTRTAEARFAVWPLDDRFVVLVFPDRPDGETVLVHLGLGDPDLPRFGVPVE